MTEKYFEIPRALLSSEQHKSEDKNGGKFKIHSAIPLHYFSLYPRFVGIYICKSWYLLPPYFELLLFIFFC